MKHQISKVALIATLAFIGVGFAGTHRANAADCPPDDCNFGEDHITPCKVEDQAAINFNYTTPVVVRSSSAPTVEIDLGCHDCDGDCYDDGRYWIVNTAFNCYTANAQGEILTQTFLDPETGEDMTYPDTGEKIIIPYVVGTQQEHSILMGLCEIDFFPDDNSPRRA